MCRLGRKTLLNSTGRRRQPVDTPDCGHAGRSLTSLFHRRAIPREVLQFGGSFGRRPTLPAQWRRQLRHVPPSTSNNFISGSLWTKFESQLSKYCVVCETG